jgi:pimeloyl-ACP methyl ester carboxylesterase
MRVLQQSGELPSSSAALRVLRLGMRELPSGAFDERLVGYLEAEAEDERRDDPHIARVSVQSLVAGQDLQDYLRHFADNEPLIRAINSVSHLPTFVILPLRGDEEEINLTYDMDSLPPSFDLRRFTGVHVFDWRAYLGSGTAIVDGRSEPFKSFWHRSARKLKFVVGGLPRLPGFLVGFVLRQGGRDFNIPLPYDPCYKDRRRRAETVHADLARRVPDLYSFWGVSAPRASVFVHGTFSNCLVGLSELPDIQNGQECLFRYEHDTFLSVESNAEELARLIQTRLNSQLITFIAHSRGGLVARLARRLLKQHPSEIRVVTLGTPHRGTPLVKLAKNNLALALRLGWVSSLGLPVLHPLAQVLSCLVGIRVPPGISIMDEDSDALRILNSLDDEGGIECWGAKFDPSRRESGYSVLLEGVLEGALFGVESDLVVPTASALGFGTPQPTLGCNHFGYLREDQVRNAIRTVCPEAFVQQAEVRRFVRRADWKL